MVHQKQELCGGKGGTRLEEVAEVYDSHVTVKDAWRNDVTGVTFFTLALTAVTDVCVGVGERMPSTVPSPPQPSPHPRRPDMFVTGDLFHGRWGG